MRRIALAICLLAFPLASAAGGGVLAQTAPLSCGDTITVDTTLDRDLSNCPNNGIVIGADGITLDLNGHTISGDGKLVRRCPRRQICDVGVANDGHDGVTVRNGSVGHFASGVLVGRARENRVLNISSSQNTFFSFVVFRSAQILVRDSSGSRNIAPDGDGMGLFESHDVQIVDNEFRRNPGPGIHVQASTDNLIKGNLISHSSPGIFLGGERRADRADRNQVRRNRFVRNAAGVLLGRGNRNVIARNRLSRDGDGIAIENGSGNLVALNVILDARKTASTSDSTSLRSAASTTSFAETWRGEAARMGSRSEARTTTASSKAISQGGQETTGSTSRAARRNSSGTGP